MAKIRTDSDITDNESMSEEQIILTQQDAQQFAAALDAAPEPTPRARAAAKAYRRRVVHAD